MTDELQSLVRQITEGHDAGADQVLCAHFRPVVRLYARRHLRDPSTVDDVVQETLATMIVELRRGALRDPDKVGQFVFGIARNKVRETRRADARRLRLDAQQVTHGHTEPVLVGFRLHLFFCLAQLTERARSVLERTYVDDEQAPAIADGLAISVANVRVIRHRALGSLRRCLEGEDA